MKILRASDYRRMAWKNGGGETAEIAVHPQGATVEDFGWRISMATVGTDGPFSVFPGIERTLSVLQGQGIRLEVEGLGARTLDPSSQPLTFGADLSTSAQLVAGPIVDLNVMTRRGAYTHAVTRHEVDTVAEIDVEEGVNILFSASPDMQVLQAGFRERLGLHDAVIAATAARTLQIEGAGPVFLISIRHLTAA